MLIILASRHDLTAPWLADQWADDGAVVLTCGELSRDGWVFRVAAPERSTAVVNGRPVAHADIRAVLTQLPSVTPHELPGIVEYDREYVAQEMNAFLLAWLDALGSRAVNQPTPFCLMGPHWRTERWVAAAHRLGIRTATAARRVAVGSEPAVPAGATRDIAVVGTHAFLPDGAPAPESVGDSAVRLARAAGADLLAVRFNEDDAVVDAHLWPDLRVRHVRDAVRAYLLRSRP